MTPYEALILQGRRLAEDFARDQAGLDEALRNGTVTQWNRNEYAATLAALKPMVGPGDSGTSRGP